MLMAFMIGLFVDLADSEELIHLPVSLCLICWRWVVMVLSWSKYIMGIPFVSFIDNFFLIDPLSVSYLFVLGYRWIDFSAWVTNVILSSSILRSALLFSLFLQFLILVAGLPALYVLLMTYSSHWSLSSRMSPWS